MALVNARFPSQTSVIATASDPFSGPRTACLIRVTSAPVSPYVSRVASYTLQQLKAAWQLRCCELAAKRRTLCALVHVAYCRACVCVYVTPHDAQLRAAGCVVAVCCSTVVDAARNRGGSHAHRPCTTSHTLDVLNTHSSIPVHENTCGEAAGYSPRPRRASARSAAPAALPWSCRSAPLSALARPTTAAAPAPAPRG
jgi:hypothetical protein